MDDSLALPVCESLHIENRFISCRDSSMTTLRLLALVVALQRRTDLDVHNAQKGVPQK